MNEGYTSIEGKVYQKVSIVMLPANRDVFAPVETGIYINALSIKGNRNPYLSLDKYLDGVQIFNSQYLYFLSNEEIKEGDWVYNKERNTVVYVDCSANANLANTEKDVRFKVIATTDPALTLNFHDGATNTEINGLPRPSNSFLEAYVREYNKGAAITEVLVEMEQIYREELINPMDRECSPSTYIPTDHYKVKIAPDNTITIKRVKEEEPDLGVLLVLESMLEKDDVSIRKGSMAHKDLKTLLQWAQTKIKHS
jgi:hypothetical protein